MKKIFLLISLTLITFSLFSATITQTYSFEKPEIVKQGQYDEIIFKNTHQFGTVGEPSLPYRGIKLLLPEGTEAKSIKITPQFKTKIKGEFLIRPVQEPKPISEITNNDPLIVSDIYSKDINYPFNQNLKLQTHFLSGFSIGFTAITPLQYNPAQQQLSYFKELTIEIETTTSNQAQQATRFLHNSDYIVNKIYKNIDNPSDISNYNLPAQKDEDIDYLLIIEEAKYEIWQEFTAILAQHNLNIKITTIEYIEENYNNSDLQKKIRSYIISEYENYPIKYILLAGDNDIIPHRGMRVELSPTQIDDDIPADMYYSCLDGTWDSNGNGYWGEPDEADLAPEIAIGRFCYNNDSEIYNFMNKTEDYLNEPAIDEVQSTLMVGEYLWEGPTWGGDYMDEMIDGSSTHGHTTVGFPSDSWDIETLYDRDYEWNSSDILNEINQGPNILNHLGHSNTEYGLKLYSDQVTDSNIYNDGTDHNFTILFTQGCYSGAFDNRTSEGYYTNDCITEKFTSIENGIVAMIANSRYGYGQQGSTNGASQFFHREFIDAVFGEEIFSTGEALNDAKIDAIPFITQPVMYWCCYETNLIGEPYLPIWTEEPADINVSYPEEVVAGSNEISISSNVTEADVCVISENSEILGRTSTDLNGNATIVFLEALQEIEDVTIAVTKHNYIPFAGTISVVPGEGPYVICNNVEYEEIGDYNDDVIQSLDILSMNLHLENIGNQDTNDDVEAVLSTGSEDVTILTNTASTNLISQNSSVTLNNAFEIELGAGINDETTLNFTIDLTSGSEAWQSQAFLQVSSSEIALSSYEINILEGSDEILNPGESAELYLTFSNTGTGISYNLYSTFFEYDPYYSISGDNFIDNIPSNDEITTNQAFILDVSEDCPATYTAQLELLAYDQLGSNMIDTLRIPIGMQVYDFENGTENWEHEALSNNFIDQWHLNDSKNHTEGGSYSFKCGGSGSSDYANSVHAGLTTPEIPITSNSQAIFYHWMSAETNSDDPDEAWDGGLLEISVNGNAFEPITPESGYPYEITNNDASPFYPGTPVFSGNIYWDEVTVDLSEYSGSVRFRFVFGSDGYVTEEGWYIDDFRIVSTSSNDNDVIQPVKFELSQNYPNPFNPETNISFYVEKSTDKTSLEIYNLKGQLVKTLVNEHLAPGKHQIVWKGKDKFGKSISSGVYFYKLQNGNESKTRKMILLK